MMSPRHDRPIQGLRFAALLLGEAVWGFLVTWVISKTRSWYGWDLSQTRLGVVLFFVALGVSGYACGTLHPNQAWLFGPASAFIPIAILACDLLEDIGNDPTSHNLWPFEVVFWPLLGLPALLGARVGAAVTLHRGKTKIPPTA